MTTTLYEDVLDRYRDPTQSLSATSSNNNNNNNNNYKTKRDSLVKLPDDSSSRLHFATYQQPSNTANMLLPTSNDSKNISTSIHNDNSINYINKKSSEQQLDVDSLSLSDIDFRILQTRLSLRAKDEETKSRADEVKSHDRPLYYQPRSTGLKNFYNELKDYIPPNVQLDEGIVEVNTAGSKLAQKQYKYSYSSRDYDEHDLLQSIKDDLEEENEEALTERDVSDNPTGEWENPIVKQAITRQVDLEYYVKMLLRNLLYFLILLTFRSLIEKLIFLYDTRLKAQPVYVQMLKENQQINRLLMNGQVMKLIGRLILIPSLLKLIFASFKLIKGQDQCWDLPLNSKQRELIGLNVDKTNLEEGERDDATLVLRQRKYEADKFEPYKILPKYRQLNQYSMFNIPSSTAKFKSGDKIMTNQSRSSERQSNLKRRMIGDVQGAVTAMNVKTRSDPQPKVLTHDSDNLATPITFSQSRYSTGTIEKAQQEFMKNYGMKL
ncbi:hypothetical protein LELG_00996 [Lodderomyces elongisporus NRRL YB-4239]|uniref:Uncharacterized protein n=1 Tax=Lodderomyces elongisporus (strain ATCC 11503 / CBS 2605 / JCM 1781 / NBRC 1676 / NRRL YB-4239) TaxID=379508 RepID=A5DUG0_LODEL|nr:hypothetical protein LELG_00996 [Lodderomyces elongisporus NRRL YB-4239]